MFTVHFSVSVPFSIQNDQYVFVSGSHELLGNWETNRALKLSKTETGYWTGTINLGVDTVKFRYFIGYFLQSESGKEAILAISKWETHLTPRCVMPPVEASKTGICRANLSDIFGYNSAREHISESFALTDEMHQITLTVSGVALKFYKHRKVQQNYRLKIIPYDLRNKFDISNFEDEDEQALITEDETMAPTLPSHSCTEIAALTQEDCPKFREQQEFGEPFHNTMDYYMFRTYSVSVENLSFRIEIYSAKTNNLVAHGYALPSTLHDSYGKTWVPLLTQKGLPIGKVYFGYLFVRPIRLPYPHPTMHNCYAKHWKKRTTLEVGHRGMGNSYTKFAVARENTLHSLNSAARNGADFVEFDVQLTKDKVPVVFHDFHVMVTVAKRQPTSTDSDTDDGNGRGKKQSTLTEGVDYYQLAVKDLNLNQLRLLYLDHIHKKGHGENSQTVPIQSNEVSTSNSHHRITGEHDEAEEHKPFPSLFETFKNISGEVGFNIELKYPQMQVNGENECDNYFERNEFVDIILAEVLNNAGHRRIVFSSFEADICKMISAKQKKYPVLLLCLGESTRHINYSDDRTRTSMTAVKFAYASGLMGVNFNSEDLLRDPSPVGKAKELGLVSFVWGDELAEKRHVEYFKKTLLVEGIIYDRIGEGEIRTNVFSLEKAMKAALFASKKSTSHSPIAPPRCSSHTQLNNQGSRVRGSGATAWSNSQQEANKNEQQNGSGMFSIGEAESVSSSSSEFPLIRRHNSSQVTGYRHLPSVAAAILENTQIGNDNNEMSSAKRFMTMASEI